MGALHRAVLSGRGAPRPGRASVPLLIGLTCLVSSGAARAQASGEPDEERRTVIHAAPSVESWAPPTSVIDRGALSDALTDAPEALDREPGVQVTRLGGPGDTATLSIRGSSAEQVRFFLDGIPLDGAEGGPVNLGGLPLGPLDSIAVYRGAAPIIYGASAIGGVVSLRSRRLLRRTLEVEVGGGSFGTRSARAFGGDGGPDWSAALALDYLGTEGDFSYLDDGGTAWTREDDRRVTRANNRLDHAALMGRGSFQVAEGIRLTLLDLFTTTDRGLPGIGLYQTRESHLVTARNLAGARLEAALGRAQLALTPYLTWSYSALDDPKDEIGLGADRTRDESVVAGVTAAARGRVELGGGWLLIPLGTLAWRHERWLPWRSSGAARGQPAASRDIASAAAELGATLPVIRGRLSGSMRWEALTDGEGGPSWAASLETRLIPATRLSLRGYGGLRLPSLFERHGDTGYILGNPDLEPERGLGGELRVLVDLGLALDLDGLLTLSASGFVTELEDLIQYVQNAQNVARPSNLSRASISGIELGAFADLLRALRLRANLTWLDATDRSEVAARAGRRLPFRPEWQGLLRVEIYQDLASDTLGELALRVELDQRSGSYLDRANLVEVPARLLVGVGASARLWRDQLRVDLALRNITDQRAQDLSGFPLPGRSVMASLRWTPEVTP